MKSEILKACEQAEFNHKIDIALYKIYLVGLGVIIGLTITFIIKYGIWG